MHIIFDVLILDCCRAEISRLQRIVELKTKEMNRVKRLAKTILDQVRGGRRLFKSRKGCVGKVGREKTVLIQSYEVALGRL